jgi:hypothetical protein
MSKSIGLIEESRMRLIPSKYWPAHEFCFHMHDQILTMLIEYETKGAHLAVEGAIKSARVAESYDVDQFDLIAFLKNDDLGKAYEHHLISHSVMGLTADMLNFLYEALMCFEKRKFTVAYSLLRKPFKENLLFLSWILSSPEDFVKNFESDTSKTLNNLNKDKQLEILENAINKLDISELYTSDLIWKLIFSKTDANSFEVKWQRATHLITTYGDNLRTKPYEINFIFKNPMDDELYEALYDFLPYVMSFVLNVCLKCFNLISGLNQQTYSHLLLTTMGCCEILISPRPGKLKMGGFINDALGSLLKCLHCEKSMRIKKSNALKLYLHEVMECERCGLESQVPLYWLFSQSNISVEKINGSMPL